MSSLHLYTSLFLFQIVFVWPLSHIEHIWDFSSNTGRNCHSFFQYLPNLFFSLKNKVTAVAIKCLQKSSMSVEKCRNRDEESDSKGRVNMPDTMRDIFF
ncbi:unnamed protein product [Calypogeia fissa]